MPVWVFRTTSGTMLNKGNVRRVLLLQQGESPVHVQRQLGHASIKLTVYTYGKLPPMGDKAAVDRLDDTAPGASGSRVVARSVSAGTRRRKRMDFLVSRPGLEPGTPCLKGRCSTD